MRYAPTRRGAFANGILMLLAACLGVTAAAAQAGASTRPAAARLEALVGAERAARLLAGEGLVASSGAGALSLAPRHEGARAVGQAVAAESPDVVVEALFLWRPGRGAIPGTLAVYNALRAVGSLEGIEYYSASRGRMRTLYERSTLVSDEAGLVALPDAVLDALPPGGEALYARQADSTFGDNVYRLSLSAGTGYVYQASTNVTPMRLGIVRVAAPGDIGLRALAIETDEGLVFYVASSAKALLLPGVRGALETSFGNRAKAAFAWFGASMDGASMDGASMDGASMDGEAR